MEHGGAVIAYRPVILSRVALLALLSAALIGCGGRDPEVQPDATIECTSTTSADAGAPAMCPSGQVCLLSRCYARCTMDVQCSRQEACVDGVCRARGSIPDSGPVDAASGSDSAVSPEDSGAAVDSGGGV